MKPLVTNAADERQIKTAEQKKRLLEQNEMNDMAVVLATPHGRRVLWRVLERCRTFSSVWENSAKIHYNAGQQDIGHWLMEQVLNVGEDQLLNLMQENKTEKI